MRVNEVSYEKKFKTIIEANRVINSYSNHDPFYIASQLGINIEFSKLTDNVKAFIIRDAHGVTIFINELADSYSRKILCAHELGHYFNGDIDGVASFFDANIDPEKEFLANIFMTILYPQAEMKLNSNMYTEIADINKYFDGLIHLSQGSNKTDTELKILNDSSTIFDLYNGE